MSPWSSGAINACCVGEAWESKVNEDNNTKYNAETFILVIKRKGKKVKKGKKTKTKNLMIYFLLGRLIPTLFRTKQRVSCITLSLVLSACIKQCSSIADIVLIYSHLYIYRMAL